MTFEKQVTWLAEPRSTSVDVWLESGSDRIAIECKLTETDFGRCSRPTLERTDSSYCDGSYRQQLARSHRCALSEVGIEYWRHIPALLGWSAEEEHLPCPFDATYQIVRNILAAVVRSDGRVDTGHGHALVVYDARNPAFAQDGAARDAIDRTTASLQSPGSLRAVSWQAIIARMSSEPDLVWLTDALADKYRLTGEPVREAPPRSSRTPLVDRPRRTEGSDWNKRLVYMPSIEPRSFIHLNVQGSSYALRSFGGLASPRRWVEPGSPTTRDLLAHHQIVHQEDAGSDRRNLNDTPYWLARVVECNNRYRISTHNP
jgi:hypothetical protein